jgi:hypothetical protein
MMAYTKFITESYRRHVVAWQEYYHRKWVASGYRDIAAHDEYLRLRDKAMKLKAETRA